MINYAWCTSLRWWWCQNLSFSPVSTFLITHYSSPFFLFAQGGEGSFQFSFFFAFFSDQIFLSGRWGFLSIFLFFLIFLLFSDQVFCPGRSGFLIRSQAREQLERDGTLSSQWNRSPSNQYKWNWSPLLKWNFKWKSGSAAAQVVLGDAGNNSGKLSKEIFPLSSSAFPPYPKRL